MRPRQVLFATILTLSAGPAPAGDAAAVAAACGAASNMPPEICACIGARAEAELDDAQRALLVAMLTGDQAAAARLRAGMAPTLMIQTASFAADAPAACAG